jgi:hypothetical protein
MLQHFKAGHHLERLLLLLCQRFRGALQVVYFDAAFELVQPRHGQRRLTHIDTGDCRPPMR